MGWLSFFSESLKVLDPQLSTESQKNSRWKDNIFCAWFTRAPVSPGPRCRMGGMF